MNCPGSVALSDKAPPDTSSEAAEEGTAAHDLGEACLLDASEARNFLGQMFNGFTVTPEMADAVQVYVSWAYEKRHEMGGIMEVESRFDLSAIAPGVAGHNDLCIYKPGKKLVIADFKYGQNVVEVNENKQLLVYALGAALKWNFDFEEVEMVIVQPRAPHPSGPIRSWTVRREYLMNWSQVMVESARLTERPGAPLSRGSWCKYCPAVGMCPRQSEAVEKALEVSMQNVVALPAPTSLSDKQISRILEARKQIEDFLDAVQKVALFRLQAGEKIDGLKLVAGRGRRTWADPEAAEAYLVERLGDAAYKRELLSVAQAEKEIPKKDLEKLWVDIPGNETVAPTSDRRKEIQPIEGILQIKKKGAKQ